MGREKRGAELPSLLPLLPAPGALDPGALGGVPHGCALPAALNPKVFDVYIKYLMSTCLGLYAAAEPHGGGADLPRFHQMCCGVPKRWPPAGAGVLRTRRRRLLNMFFQSIGQGAAVRGALARVLTLQASCSTAAAGLASPRQTTRWWRCISSLSPLAPLPGTCTRCAGRRGRSRGCCRQVGAGAGRARWRAGGRRCRRNGCFGEQGVPCVEQEWASTRRRQEAGVLAAARPMGCAELQCPPGCQPAAASPAGALQLSKASRFQDYHKQASSASPAAVWVRRPQAPQRT